MHEIKCPHCGKVFTVDESGYQEIAAQVRGKELDKELKTRIKDIEGRKDAELKAELTKQQNELDKKLASKADEITGLERKIDGLKAELGKALKESELAVEKAQGEKDREREEALRKKADEISSLNAKISELSAKLEESAKAQENRIQLAVEKLQGEKDREREEALKKKADEISSLNAKISELSAKLEESAKAGETSIQLAVEKLQGEKDREREEALKKKVDEISSLNAKISELSAKLEEGARAQEDRIKLAVTEAVQEKDRQINEQSVSLVTLQNDLERQKSDSEAQAKKDKEFYDKMLAMKDADIAQLKDMKAKLSTKMIGEDLEQHCLNEFNKVRMMAFPNAYFEKDNDSSSGTKGDFIFRDFEEGTEFISIMFEMKNEADTTAEKQKHKNENFFKKLDKDRNEKNCEYAVLVSLLEQDNEFYNTGIVQVHQYKKMYVIRPQFFVQLISILRNAALSSVAYRVQLEEERNAKPDFTNFDQNLAEFKSSFNKTCLNAQNRLEDAIDEIDKAISELEKTKKNLSTTLRHLNSAGNKADSFTIRTLTYNAPAVKQLYDAQTQGQAQVQGHLLLGDE